MEIEKHPWPTTFLLEEPDVYLHPGLQRRFVDYLQARCIPRSDGHAGHQFLIATHSPYMVNAVAEVCRKLGPDGARLFQMIRTDSAVSVRPVSSDDDHWNALVGIGHRPADVLLPNGLIWVEGPSDVVYLKHWLSKYAKEVDNYDIAWGRDAEILWYGGNQWANMGGKNVLWDGMDDECFRRLLNILTINHNGSVVIDRDEGDSKTAQRKHKDRLSAELSEFDPPRRVWMTENRCIEFYIKNQSSDAKLQQVFQNCRSVGRRKVERARKYVACTESKRLEEIVDMDTDIGHQLQITYDEIRRWGG
jgi:hypothetical protein